MKQFGILLLGVSLAVMTSCSSNRSDDEPMVPKQPEETKSDVKTSDKTGKFDVEWNCMGMQPTMGKFEADNEYFFCDDFPVEAIFGRLVEIVREGAKDKPDRMAQLTDEIGNIFFASDYKYPDYGVDQILRYVNDDPHHARVVGIVNAWTTLNWAITIDKVAPYPSETIFIDSPELMTFSFGVDADGVSYRVDLTNKDKEVYADFDETTGLWSFNYWFSAFKIINLSTGQEYSKSITVSSTPQRNDKEDTILLEFKATRRTGDAEERVILH